MSDHVFESPSNRKFGITVGSIFILLALINTMRFETLLYLGILLVTLGLIAPSLLTWANKAWMKLGDLLHGITNPIIMALLYFFIFCPMGFLLCIQERIRSVNSANMKKQSYWIQKNTTSEEWSMKNQY